MNKTFLQLLWFLLWLNATGRSFLLSSTCRTRLSRNNGSAALCASTTKNVPATLGPDPSTKPNYEETTGPWGKRLDKFLQTLFVTKLAEQVGLDGDDRSSSFNTTDFSTITRLTAQLVRDYPIPDVQRRAQTVLTELFPSWLPPQYQVLFSRPFPKFSARMNAWATYMFSAWLMGESEVNDVPVRFFDNGTVAEMGMAQGVLVKRCRFLEEAGCASVCVNACKIPTQNFFVQSMGIPLTMEPNYETHECQFSFGRVPNITTEMAASSIPCLSRCPTAGSYRSLHDNLSLSSLSQCDKMTEPA